MTSTLISPERILSTRRRALVVTLPLALLGLPRTARAQSASAGVDHRHGGWDALLRQHVVVAAGGNASTPRYAALQTQRAALKSYLDSLSAVSPASYGTWSKAQQLAFLINAYNAFTVELILTRYPDLKSIKDLGSFVQSPWKKKFFQLLGQERSLDEVEHEMIRAPGVFDDPRIHVAVVCASVGCPMLRNEAFVAERLDAQLEDAMRRFLSDRSRNRFDAGTGTLFASKIFDWYRKDFERGHKGYDSLQALFARHAEVLGATPQAQAEIRSGRYKLAFLDYDWALNDAR
jgi:Protein of unknown function, DUF547